jgi:hypothetical protein
VFLIPLGVFGSEQKKYISYHNKRNNEKQVPTANLGTNSGALTLSAETEDTACNDGWTRNLFLL